VLGQREHQGLIYYVSPLLEAAGVPHAFSTVVEDVRSPTARDFALGSAADHPHPVGQAGLDANYARLAQACGLGRRLRLFVKQVHGSAVLHHAQGRRADGSNLELGEGDGIVTHDAATYAAVRGADCAMVLLADVSGKWVAAAHAGWRGAVAGVVVRTVQAMRAAGAGGEIVAAIGPCIGFQAMEIGPEVVAEFVKMPAARGQLAAGRDGKGHVNLRGVLAAQLRGAGVGRIDVAEGCTVLSRLPDGSALFSSHRREGRMGRRLAGLIGPLA
jgi:YfiH family protein